MGMTASFGRRLESALEARNITKYRLAKLTGISAVQIGRLVSGDRDPTPESLHAIAPHLGIGFDELMAWAEADRLIKEGADPDFAELSARVTQYGKLRSRLNAYAHEVDAGATRERLLELRDLVADGETEMKRLRSAIEQKMAAVIGPE